MLDLNKEFSLWQAFKAGDKDAFHNLYLIYFDSLYNYGMRLTMNKDLVGDAIHDLFIKLWKNRANLGDINRLRAYLLVSLRSVIRTQQEKDNRMLKGFKAFPDFELEISAESVRVRQETDQQMQEQLLVALKSLTGRQKEILFLRYYEQFTYDEIANAMHITVKASYKLMARSLEALKQIMGPLPVTILLFFLTKEVWVNLGQCGG